MSWVSCPDVEAIAFNRNPLDVVAEQRQLAGERLANGRLHSSGRFDVDEFTSESEDVHLGRIDDFTTAAG